MIGSTFDAGFDGYFIGYVLGVFMSFGGTIGFSWKQWKEAAWIAWLTTPQRLVWVDPVAVINEVRLGSLIITLYVMRKNIIIGLLILTIAVMLFSERNREIGTSKTKDNILRSENSLESDEIISDLKEKNAQLTKENKKLMSELSESQYEHNHAKENYSNNTPQVQNNDRYYLEDDGITNNSRYYIEDDGENLSLYDQNGKALFEYNTEKKKLFYNDGLHLDKLGIVIFDKDEFIGDLKSTKGKEKATLTFENTRDETAYIYWVDYQGKLKYHNTIKPGKKYSQQTFMTHPWIIVDEEGNKHADLEPIYIDENEDIIISD